MKKQSGKSFFDYTTKEKKRVVSEAAKESNRAQRALVEQSGKAEEWRKEFDEKLAMLTRIQSV